MKTDSSQQELPGKLYGKKIQTEDINGVPVIQNETINEVPVVQPVAAHFITHDPAEEEVAWMKNSLVGVINEATDLPITVWNVSSNNKIISAYGRAIDYKLKLQELDPLHYLVSEAIEYSMAAFDLMKQEDESETETSTADTLMDLEICKTAVSDVPVEILFRKYWREDHHYKISGVFGIKFQLRKLLNKNSI
ncbi:hypothetical protein D5086_032707 [Populus alba]|uniref:Uncharacterized protein n=2 Tax=Populus alba TaxID=43335 RepID=A0ACC4AES8_POPAL